MAVSAVGGRCLKSAMAWPRSMSLAAAYKGRRIIFADVKAYLKISGSS